MSKRRVAIALVVALVVVALGPYLWFRARREAKAVELHSVKGAKDARAAELKVLTWNVAHGRGDGADAKNTGQTRAERRARLQEIVAVVRAADADVVVLNEIDFDTTWSARVNQAHTIGTRAGYAHVVTQRNLDVVLPFYRWRFGNAILSRVPLEKPRLVRHAPFKAWEDLLAGNHDSLRTTLKHPELGAIDLWAVHLESRDERSPPSRSWVLSTSARYWPATSTRPPRGSRSTTPTPRARTPSRSSRPR